MKWAAAAAALLVVLALVRQPLSEWLWPETRIQALRTSAERALAEGRLTAPDGTGARELFEAALALDPDRPGAREGLARVGDAALARADAAVRAGQPAQAREYVALARALGVPKARVDSVERAMRQREIAEAGIAPRLASARAARAAGRMHGSADSALAHYAAVLELQPGNTEALEGRDDVIADMLADARRRLAAAELETAVALVREARGFDPAHADLPAALAAVNQSLEATRARAERDLRSNRLTHALAGFDRVLAVQPDDDAARAGRHAVGERLLQRSQRFAADFRFSEAEAALAVAEDVLGATNADVVEARAHIARARRSQAQLGSGALTPERQRRLKQLLEEAAAAEARGNLLLPPGENAFDKVRAARAISPDDRRVKAASARLVPAARRCFDTAMRENRLVSATACLDAGRALDPAGGWLPAARSRLAQRWVAVGNERLGAGELDAARRALDAATALDPAVAGAVELSARLRQASAAGP
ncbi:hypothetical protein [Lysobacter olei]